MVNNALCRIILENLENNEVIFHELVLLRGKILPEFASQLFISCNSSRIEFVLTDSSYFLALVELKVGENRLKFFLEDDDDDIFRLFYKPKKCDRILQTLYVVLKDETDSNVITNVDLNLHKISLVIKLLQLFVAEELKSKFGERKSFNFYNEENNICTVFYSKYSASDLCDSTQEEIYWKLANEIIGSCKRRGFVKYLAILSCTKFCNNHKVSKHGDWIDQIDRTQFYVNFAVGDVAVVNGGGLYTWPSRCQEVLARFLDVSSVPNDRLNDSAGRDTVGGVFATTLGLTMHELGHVFNLVHNSNGIMGRDFDNIQLAYIGDHNKSNLAAQRKSRHHKCLSNCNFDKNNAGLQEEIFYHFAEGALLLLNHHPWLTQADEDVQDCEKLDTSSKAVISKHGLIFVELRTKDGESVIYWDLRLFKPKRWMIPSEIPRNKNYCLFVLDNCGCIKTFEL